MTIYKDLKVLDLQANACLAHLVRHWTPKPVIIWSIRSSPTGGNFFFAIIKSFEYKIAISVNFVQTVKNSSDEIAEAMSPWWGFYLWTASECLDGTMINGISRSEESLRWLVNLTLRGFNLTSNKLDLTKRFAWDWTEHLNTQKCMKFQNSSFQSFPTSCWISPCTKITFFTSLL